MRRPRMSQDILKRAHRMSGAHRGRVLDLMMHDLEEKEKHVTASQS